MLLADGSSLSVVVGGFNGVYHIVVIKYRKRVNISNLKAVCLGCRSRIAEHLPTGYDLPIFRVFDLDSCNLLFRCLVNSYLLNSCLLIVSDLFV